MMRWLIVPVLAVAALPAGAHDHAAWSDPVRDDWYRSLHVPGSNTSCCNFSDAAMIDPDKVRQRGSQWFVDLGDGFIPVPPESVVHLPPSIDGLPYIFLVRVPGSAPAIRCFVPPVGTY